ncbi:MAG: DISARM system phospholipase D-like protein DrmC [Solirubrobacteraceae bacterium]
MIEPLLALPAHLRERLARALESGYIDAPFTRASLRSALGSDAGVDEVRAALGRLADRGISGPAVALALDAVAAAAAQVDRPDLVWSGPAVPGLQARDTRRVYEELVAGAERSIWVSTFAYYDGRQAFRTLAARMDEAPAVQVTLLLNIQRRPGDTTAADAVVARFAERFWTQDWPGERRPSVFYDPRSLGSAGHIGVLHAKAVVVDDQAAFVTSANLTEAAFDRNVEVGVLSRERTLAASLTRHFRVLIDQKLLLPLPRG